MSVSAKLRTGLLKAGLLLFLGCLLCFPSTALAGAKDGLLLWFYQVMPSLLPFLILSSLFFATGLSDRIAGKLSPLLSPVFRCSSSGCYAVVIGLLSGLPVGAKTVADLTSTGRITKKEGTYLLPLCNNPSPLFLLGFISLSVIKQPALRYPLFLTVVLSSIVAAMLLRPRESTSVTSNVSSRDHALTPANRSGKPGPGSPAPAPFTFSFLLLDAAIEQAFLILTKVGGYLVLFSVLAKLLAVLPLPATLLACFGAFLEITTGSNALSALSLAEPVRISLITGFVTFGGLSSVAQTKSVLTGTTLPLAHYLLTKAVAGLIAGLLMWFFLLFVM